jgi:GH24 family phage-related lysozyme (muramidase)
MDKFQQAYWRGFLKAAGAPSVSPTVPPPVTATNTPSVTATNTPPTPTNLFSRPVMRNVPRSPLPPVTPPEDVYNMIKRHEGFVPTNYLDHLGNPTIGYGSTNPKLLRAGRITEPQAAAELTNKVDAVRSNVQSVVGTDEFNSLPPQGQSSLIDLGYQTGSLSKWPRLTKAVKENDLYEAADEIEDSTVNNQTPNRNSERIRLMLQALQQRRPDLYSQTNTPID